MKQKRSSRPPGQIRQSQVVTTFGPGAMLDLPNHSVLVAGLDYWSAGGEEIHEGAFLPDPLGEGTDVDVQKSLLGSNGGRTVGSWPRGPQHMRVTDIPRCGSPSLHGAALHCWCVR